MAELLWASFIANNSGNAVLACSSADAQSWSGNTDIGQTSKFGPSLAVFNGKLFVAFIADNSGNAILVCSTTDGQNWSANSEIGQTSKAEPCLTAFNPWNETVSRLFVAFIANESSNTVLVCSSADGQTWSGNTNIGQTSKFGPSLAVFNGKLYIAFIANDSSNAVLVCSSYEGVSWTNYIGINQSSGFAPSLAVSSVEQSLTATFTGTLTITNTQQPGQSHTSNVTLPVSFLGSNPWNVIVPPVTPETFPVLSDTITATPDAAGGTYEQTGQLNLALPITLQDTQSLLAPNPQTVQFALSTSGTLTMTSAGSTATGCPLNAQGAGTITLVGSANVTVELLGAIGVGLVLAGTLTGSLPPAPAPLEKVTVPFVVGLNYTKAVAEINAAGLDLMVTDDETQLDTDWNKVLTQAPPGGSSVVKGSLVNLSVGVKPSGGGGPGGGGRPR